LIGVSIVFRSHISRLQEKPYENFLTVFSYIDRRIQITMPAVASVSYPQGGEPMSMLNTNRPPLRRAVYVHVSDLISSYNIDHARLEEELARVKADSEKPEEDTSPSRPGGLPTELDTSYPQKRLQPPRGGYNLCVLVGKVDIVVDKNRVDGSRVRLAEVDVGDETGAVSLRARDDQIDILQQVSDRNGAAVLRNCTLELYQGKHIRLAVTKWGKLSPFPDNVASTPPPPTKINHERNFSMIDLSVVASEMATFPQMDAYQGTEMEGSPQQHSVSGRGQPYAMQQQQQSQQQLMYNQSRRGSARRQTHRSTPMQQHYTERYPGGLHGYGTGFNSRMEPQSYPYSLRQSPEAQQQMMMHHHQFEMQQRHIHQMYHPSTPRQQDHSSTGQPSSPMVAPGIPNQGSFDAYGPQEVNLRPGMMGVNPFLQHQQQQAKIQGGHSTPATVGQQSWSSEESPTSPPMNPQAATFDPSSAPQEQQYPHPS
jgi:replication factor A1